MTIQERRALYVTVFVQEFLREFQFLSDVVAGRATRKGDFTDKLLRILSAASVTDSSGIAGAVTSGFSFLYGSSVEAQLATTLGHLSDLVDREALRILVEQVAETAARRYDFFVTMRMTEDPIEGVIPLAKAGVERVLEYLVRKNLPLTHEHLTQGLLEGRSGAYISGFKNTALKGNAAYSKARFTAEGLYARSAFQTPDGRVWSRKKATSRRPGAFNSRCFV